MPKVPEQPKKIFSRIPYARMTQDEKNGKVKLIQKAVRLTDKQRNNKFRGLL